MILVAVAIVILSMSVVYAVTRLCGVLQPWSALHVVRLGLLKEKQEARAKAESRWPLPSYYPGTKEEQEKKEEEREIDKLTWRIKKAREDLRDLK
ncbi:MAG: hypothetical protein WBE86_01900 [Candidatus Acidiferrales bacterium]